MNIILIGRDADNTTKGRPVQVCEFRDLLLDNNQNELFFADKVIVCEGLDAYVVRLIANELFPKKLDEQNVSVVMVGGKDRLSKMCKLVLKLGLKCFVLADFDYLLRDKSDDIKKYKDAKPHESILSCGEPFYTQQCISDEKGSEIYKKIEKVRNYLKKENEEAFYCAKTVSEFGDKRLIKFLSELRKNGIGILNTEIEGLFKDASMLNGTKANLEVLFDVNTRLSNGEKVTDLFETVEIVEFLETVLAR